MQGIGSSFFDLLALNPQQLRKPASLTCIYEIIARRLALRAGFGFDNRILQHAECGDAGGERLDLRFRMRHLAYILRRLLQFADRHHYDVAGISGFLGPIAHGFPPFAGFLHGKRRA